MDFSRYPRPEDYGVSERNPRGKQQEGKGHEANEGRERKMPMPWNVSRNNETGVCIVRPEHEIISCSDETDLLGRRKP